MKRFTTVALLAPLAVLAFAAVPALRATSLVSSPGVNPGVVYTLEITSPGEPAPRTVTASIEGLNLKMDVAPEKGGDRAEMIFRGDRKEMIIVDHSRRAYMVMDRATMSQMTDQMSAAMAQAQEQMKSMPPEQRAMMEQMMKGRGMAMPAAQPAQPELRRTTERAKQSGYDTVKYEIVREGKVERALWVTDWSNLTGASEARPAFEGMAAFMQQMASGLAQFGGGMVQDGFRYMKDMNGFPVLTVEYDNTGKLTNETRLVSATSQTLSAATFEPPTGFTRQSIGR